MLKIFSQETSIHGIKYIFTENDPKASRLFWTFIILLSFSGLTFYVYYSYLKWQIDPEIVMRSRERNSSDFPAPAVTVCTSLFTKNNLSNYMKFINHKNYENLKVNENECKYLAGNSQWCQVNLAETAEKLCGDFDVSKIDVVKSMMESSLKIPEALLNCQKNTCDQVLQIFTDYGICYTQNMLNADEIFNNEIHDDFKKFYTNSDSTKIIHWTVEKGYVNQLTDKPQRSTLGSTLKFYPILNEVDKQNLCTWRALRIVFHKPNEIPTPFHNSYYLSHGDYVRVDMTLKSHQTDEALKSFTPDVRKCYFEDERKLKFFRTYSKAHCKWECKANQTLDACGCVKFSMPRDNEMKVCNISKIKCMQKVKYQSCRCYESCVDLNYNYKIEKIQFDQGHLVDGVDKNFSTSSIWTRIEVHTKAEFVEEIENFVSYKIQNFIADFGGLLGLFLGCSLLSIIEIFYFIVKGCLKSKNASKIIPENEEDVKKVHAKIFDTMRKLQDEVKNLRKELSGVKKYKRDVSIETIKID